MPCLIDPAYQVFASDDRQRSHHTNVVSGNREAMEESKTTPDPSLHQSRAEKYHSRDWVEKYFDGNFTSSEEEEDEEEAFISEILYSCSQRSSFEKTSQKFVPIDAIDRIFAYGAQGMNVSPDPRHRVLKLLGKRLNAEEEASLLDFIVTRAKRLFLICIRSHQPHLHTKMTMFMEHEFDDGQLPIKSVMSTKPGDTPDDHTLSFMSTKPADIPNDHPFFIMNKAYHKAYPKGKRRHLWKMRNIEVLFDSQWMFLAPIISTTTLLQDFGQRTMPFISSEAPPSFRGTFSIVTRYEVHHAHIDNAHEVIVSNISHQPRPANDRSRHHLVVA